jgi:hypothetical protein
VIEDQLVEAEELDQEPESASPSLANRMAKRHQELARQTTRRFPVPGWEDVLEVELQPVGAKPSVQIVQRAQRARDDGTRQLYVAADMLLRATVGFWEMPENGGRAKRLDGEDWISLARRLEACPDNPTPRQALLFLLPDERLLPWYAEWEQWQVSSSRDVDEETMRDFVPTG